MAPTTVYRVQNLGANLRLPLEPDIQSTAAERFFLIVQVLDATDGDALGLPCPDPARSAHSSRIRERLRQPRLQPFDRARLAFPDHHDAKAVTAQGPDRLRVAAAVGRELVSPEGLVGLGHGRVFATGVLMPEATVDVDRPSPSPVGEIRRAREPARVEAIG